MVFQTYLQWDLIIVATLFLFGFVCVFRLHSKNKILNRRANDHSKMIKSLQEDIKVLYESASNLGINLKKVEYGAKVLKEQQEQLTLKEPNQQAYRNAIQSIQNGETISKVSEISGLSRGEVELLKMFQKFDVNVDDKHSETIE